MQIEKKAVIDPSEINGLCDVIFGYSNARGETEKNEAWSKIEKKLTDPIKVWYTEKMQGEE